MHILVKGILIQMAAANCKDGTNYLLEVKSMKNNAGIPANQFVFSQSEYESKDYDVVDFR